jgi:hypothetical protein
MAATGLPRHIYAVVILERRCPPLQSSINLRNRLVMRLA